MPRRTVSLLIVLMMTVIQLPRCTLAETAFVFGDQLQEAEDHGDAASPDTDTVRIMLEDDVPGNRPYQMSGTYDRDLAVPLLNGARGFRYRITTQVVTWLFPISLGDGPPTLLLRLEGVSDLCSVSINDQLLSAQAPVILAMRETAELRVATADRRCLIRLVFTTLPVIHLQPSGGIYAYRDTDCRVTIADPEYKAHGQDGPLLTCEATVSRHGQSSSRYNAKHPYKFSLLKDGVKWDKSLLGLRCDSDWLLDSAYNDASRMRNRVLMDVWSEVYRLPWDQSRSGATKGVFVEVLVNDQYRGLYVLSEKQDRRQLGLARTGARWNSLFLRTAEAGKNATSPAGFVSLGKERPEAGDPLRWYNVRLHYPLEQINDYQALWSDFYDYVYLVIRGSAGEFASRISQYADLDNLARYWLFVNSADITDNMRKNMTFVRLDDRDERFDRFILIPWDMDSSLGRYYSSKKSRPEEVITNRLFKRLFEEDPEGFRQMVYDDWQELRQGALSLETIMDRFEGYYRLIHVSGADAREMEAHPTFTSYLQAGYTFTLDLEKEIDYIRSFTEARLRWLDGQVEALVR